MSRRFLRHVIDKHRAEDLHGLIPNAPEQPSLSAGTHKTLVFIPPPTCPNVLPIRPTMFGAIVSGRPVLTDVQTISQTQFAFTLPAAPPFSHIVIFLLPGTALPADTAAAVYVQLPDSPEFKLLGGIANEKPTAIFKVNNKAIGIYGVNNDDDAMVDESAAPPLSNDAAGNVTLGISVEPAAQVAANITQMKAQAAQSSSGLELVRCPPGNSPVPTKALAQKIIKNAFNFLASFAGNGPGGNEVVPLKVFQDWWSKFEKRIEHDPGFLERDDES